MASDLATDVQVPVAPVIPVAHERVTAETQSLDTDGDLSITHKDAWLVTQFLKQQAVALSNAQVTDSGLIGESEANADLDVNSDGIVSPSDVLWIVDRIQFYNPLVPCNCSACVQSALGNSCSSVEIGRIQAITMVNSPAAPSQGEPADKISLAWNNYPAPLDSLPSKK